MSMKKKVLFIIFILVLVAGIVVYLLDRYPNLFLFWQKGTLEEVTTYSNNTGNYNCSKPIAVISRPNPDYNPTAIRTSVPNSPKYYSDPINPAEAKLFCRSYMFIESEGILKVLQMPEVLDLVNKYQYNQVSVVALKFDLIKDKDFVKRLLPTYKDKEIGCIIIVETPGEKKVYLEDEKLQAFEELDYKIFNQYLDSVSPEDKQLFIENLH